jgi:hypothetical protein
MHLKRETFDDETLGQCAFELYGSNRALFEVFDGAACGTDKVVVWFRIRIDAQRAAMEVDLVHDPRFEKCVERLVDSRQRHRGHLSTNLLVDLFRIRMPGKRSQSLKDYRALVRSGQAMLMAKLAKRLRAIRVLSGGMLHKGVDEAKSQRIRV